MDIDWAAEVTAVVPAPRPNKASRPSKKHKGRQLAASPPPPPAPSTRNRPRAPDSDTRLPPFAPSFARNAMRLDFRGAPLGDRYPGLVSKADPDGPPAPVEVVHSGHRATVHAGTALPLSTRVNVLFHRVQVVSNTHVADTGHVSHFSARIDVLDAVQGYSRIHTDEATIVRAVFGSREAFERETTDESRARFGPLFGTYTHSFYTLAHRDVVRFLAMDGAPNPDDPPAADLGSTARRAVLADLGPDPAATSAPLRETPLFWEHYKSQLRAVVLREDLERIDNTDDRCATRFMLQLLTLICTQYKVRVAVAIAAIASLATDIRVRAAGPRVSAHSRRGPDARRRRERGATHRADRL
jgi:hypothetical protein